MSRPSTLTRPLVLGALCAALGCGTKPEPPQVFTAAETQPVSASPPSAPPLEEQGELLEGDLTIAGLTLPRAFREVPEEKTDQTRVFLTTASPDQTLRYLGTRVLTGQVERIGAGATYRNATPKGAATHLDISILPSTTGTRITLTELPAAPLQPRRIRPTPPPASPRPRIPRIARSPLPIPLIQQLRHHQRQNPHPKKNHKPHPHPPGNS